MRAHATHPAKVLDLPEAKIAIFDVERIRLQDIRWIRNRELACREDDVGLVGGGRPGGACVAEAEGGAVVRWRVGEGERDCAAGAGRGQW